MLSLLVTVYSAGEKPPATSVGWIYWECFTPGGPWVVSRVRGLILNINSHLNLRAGETRTRNPNNFLLGAQNV